jgi:hypothetical protein
MINQVSSFCSLNTTRSSSSILSNKPNNDSSDRIKKIETKKRVRFHKKVKVKSTIHLKHYTNQEIELCWYTPVEYNHIIEGLYLTLDLMKISLAPYNCLFSNSSSKCKGHKSSSLSSLYCSRGLENLSIEGGLKHSTRKRRQNAIWSVLDEQNVQYEEAILQQQRTFMYDAVKIGNAYRYHTRISEKIAFSKGRIDAADEESSLSSSSSALLIELENNMNNNCEDEDTSSVLSYSSLETTIVAASTTQSSAPITIITYDSKNSSSDNKKNYLSFRRGGPAKRRWSFVNTRVQSCIPLCA